MTDKPDPLRDALRECEAYFEERDADAMLTVVQAALRTPALASDEWQPIETAPKDGTRILLWIEPTRIAMPFEWSEGRWMGDDYPLNMATSTHWRPLPARTILAAITEPNDDPA